MIARDRRDWTELLGNVRIQFWICLNDSHRTVTWTGNVASCDTCGLTSEMTARFATDVRDYERERIGTLLKRAADGRREYAGPDDGSEARPLLLTSAEGYEAALQLIKDPKRLLDVIPAWRWTPEEHASIRPKP